MSQDGDHVLYRGLSSCESLSDSRLIPWITSVQMTLCSVTANVLISDADVVVVMTPVVLILGTGFQLLSSFFGIRHCLVRWPFFL